MEIKRLSSREISADKYLKDLWDALYWLRQKAYGGLERDAVQKRISKILESAEIEENSVYNPDHPAKFMRTIYGAIENYIYLGWPTPAHILCRVKEIKGKKGA